METKRSAGSLSLPSPMWREIPLPGEMARRAKGVPPRQAGEPRRGSSPFLKIQIKKTNPITFGFDLISGAPSGTRTAINAQNRRFYADF